MISLRYIREVKLGPPSTSHTPTYPVAITALTTAAFLSNEGKQPNRDRFTAIMADRNLQTGTYRPSTRNIPVP